MPRGVRNTPASDTHTDLQRFIKSMTDERGKLEASLPRLDAHLKPAVLDNLNATSKVVEGLHRIADTISDQRDLLVIVRRRLARAPRAPAAGAPAPAAAAPQGGSGVGAGKALG